MKASQDSGSARAIEFRYWKFRASELDWLKRLSLAPKSKSHLKNLMRVLFNAAMRWELIPYQLNPMGLVRVKDGSKRKREPKALSAGEFRQMLEHIPEPFRTMCIVAMCRDFGLAKYSA